MSLSPIGSEWVFGSLITWVLLKMLPQRNSYLGIYISSQIIKDAQPPVAPVTSQHGKAM